MPTLVRFLLVHAAIGFGVAFVFVGTFLYLDIGGLRTLMMSSGMGYMALFLFTFFNGLTFSSVQMGVAVMLLGEDEGDAGGRGHWVSNAWTEVRAWLAPPMKRVPVPVRHNR